MVLLRLVFRRRRERRRALGINALVIGFPEGGEPGLMWDFANCAFQSSCNSPPLGDFFLAKSPVFGEAKHPTGFRTLFWFFEQLANTH